MLPPLLQTMRPKQWIKNLLLFAGVFFSKHLFELNMVWHAFLGFVVFCALSGVVYIFNDVADAESDKAHPIKRSRPIPSGRLAPSKAVDAGIAIGGLALIGAYLINTEFGYIATLYFALMLGYSFFFKHMVILDLMLLALGFVMRAVAGVLAIRHLGQEVAMTTWFLSCAFFLSLFLAICKRRHELLLLEGAAQSHRPVLQDYSPSFLDQMVSIATAAAIISYAIYTTSAEAIGGGALVYTLPFVVYGVFRYLYQVYRRELGGAPEVIFLTDRWLLTNVLLYAASVAYILYSG